MVRKAFRNAKEIVHPCTIESVTDLGKRCAKALKEALDLPLVVAREVSRSHGVTGLYFQGVPPIVTEVNGENRPIIPVAGAVARWLQVSIDLRAAAGLWYVRHVSIDLLKGDLAADKKSLLRAEWMMLEGLDGTGHAQPHWHALYGIDPTTTFAEVVPEPSVGFNAFLEEGSATEVEPSPTEPDGAFKHFHYAMVSDWHRTPSIGVQHALSDEAELLAWLGGCVSYIQRQLNHVDRKAGSGAFR